MANIVDILLKVKDDASGDLKKFSENLDKDLVSAAKKGNQAIIDAFERMGEFSDSNSNKAKNSLKSAINEAEDFAKRAEKSVSKVTSDIEKDFKELGIKSEKSIDDARKEIISSFLRIKKSGQASSKDISNAYKAMNKRLKSLDGLDKVKKDVKQINKSTSKLSSGLKALGGAFAVSSIVSGFKNLSDTLIQNTSELADEAHQLTNLSQQAGFTTDTIQALSHAASRNAIDTQDAKDALRDLNFEIGDAYKRSGDSEKRFTDLGIAIRYSSGKIRDNEDILRDLSSALQGIENPAERAASLARILGEDNQKLLPILAQGAESIDDYTNSLKSMGGYLDEIAIAKLEKFEQTMAKIRAEQKQTKIETINVASTFAEMTQSWLTGASKIISATEKVIPTLEHHSDIIFKTNFEQTRQLREISEARLAEQKAIEKSSKAEIKAIEKTIELQLMAQKTREDNAQKQLVAIAGMIKKQTEFNNKLQDEIDKRKAANALSDTERTSLLKGIERRKLDRETKAIELEAEELGITDTSKIAELQKLKQKELEDSFSDSNEEIERASDKIKKYKESVSDTTEDIGDLTETIEDTGESAKKAEGSLGQMLAGMDAIGARAFEFMGAGQRNTGASAFGTAGTANDAESLLRVADRARAEALREQINLARSGQIQVDTSKLDQWIQEFEKISTELGGLGSVGTGSGRAGALLGDRKITIEFNPTQDYDNLSAASQRQLAEGIANAIQ